MNKNNNDIKPIAIPGIHQAFIKFLLKSLAKKSHVLDAGAGHGALSKTLVELGYQVTACDYNDEIFYYNEVDFYKADLTKKLPFSDENFDAVIAVEVMEHIFDHENFFSEAYRILKKNGKLLISTPNILSLKSRLRFFFSGYFYSFAKIDYNRDNGLQHIAALTFDQFVFLAHKFGFFLNGFAFDKKQPTSKLFLFLYPFLLLYGKIKKTGNYHNSLKLLTGRVVFMEFNKK